MAVVQSNAPKTVSLSVQTGAEYLVSWLNEAIRDAPERQFMHEYDVPYRLRFEWWTKPLLTGALEGYSLMVFVQPIRPNDVAPEDWPDLPETAPAWLEVLPMASDLAQVVARFDDFIIGQYIRSLLETIRRHFPSEGGDTAEKPPAKGLGVGEPGRPRDGRPLGMHGGTLDRVQEVQQLVKRGTPKTEACRRVGIDPRTFDRYVDIEEDPEDKF